MSLAEAGKLANKALGYKKKPILSNVFLFQVRWCVWRWRVDCFSRGTCPALPCLALPGPALPCPALPCPAFPSQYVDGKRQGEVELVSDT